MNIHADKEFVEKQALYISTEAKRIFADNDGSPERIITLGLSLIHLVMWNIKETIPEAIDPLRKLIAEAMDKFKYD